MAAHLIKCNAAGNSLMEDHSLMLLTPLPANLAPMLDAKPLPPAVETGKFIEWPAMPAGQSADIV